MKPFLLSPNGQRASLLRTNQNAAAPHRCVPRIGVTVVQKPVKAPCSLFYTTRSRRIKAAEYTVSFYLLKFALQTCIVTAQSHFITTVRKKARKKLKLFSCLFIEVGMQGTGRWIGLDLSKETYEMRYFDQKEKVAGSGGLTTKAGRAKLYAKLKPGIPHYNDCNTLSRQSSRLLHRCCLWRSGIFFALIISEKSTCLSIFKTIFRKTLKFAAALSFRTRQ